MIDTGQLLFTKQRKAKSKTKNIPLMTNGWNRLRIVVGYLNQ